MRTSVRLLGALGSPRPWQLQQPSSGLRLRVEAVIHQRCHPASPSPLAPPCPGQASLAYPSASSAGHVALAPAVMILIIDWVTLDWLLVIERHHPRHHQEVVGIRFCSHL